MYRRKWPHQITEHEQSVMKRLFSQAFFKGWAVYQIAVYSLVNNLLAASVGTWYKYVRALGIKYHHIRKNKQKTGVRASKPNELWHMDVTIFKTLDNCKARIYILIDNFSRYILGWRVAPVASGKICLGMLREAYDTYLKPFPNNNDTTVLLADGGPENNNSDVDGFLEQPLIPIKKLIAQKDIEFSNSMVEAFNKTLKYRHLFPYEIRDFGALEKHLQKCIPEYNNVRPHCAHKYLTPSQAYFGNSIDRIELRKRLFEARNRRILDNRNASCIVCSSNNSGLQT